MAPLGFNLLLIMVTLVLAFLTRKLPDNFKESMCVFICACSNLFLWISFLPAYLTVPPSPSRELLLVLASLVTGSFLSICFFGSRVLGVILARRAGEWSSSGPKVIMMTSPTTMSKCQWWRYHLRCPNDDVIIHIDSQNEHGIWIKKRKDREFRMFLNLIVKNLFVICSVQISNFVTFSLWTLLVWLGCY